MPASGFTDEVEGEGEAEVEVAVDDEPKVLAGVRLLGGSGTGEKRGSGLDGCDGFFFAKTLQFHRSGAPLQLVGEGGSAVSGTSGNDGSAESGAPVSGLSEEGAPVEPASIGSSSAMMRTLTVCDLAGGDLARGGVKANGAGEEAGRGAATGTV